MNNTLQVTKCNHIEYLHHNHLRIIFRVFPTPTNKADKQTRGYDEADTQDGYNT